jgi:hypothetical protein
VGSHSNGLTALNAICRPQIASPLPTTIQDQHLMSHQDGFGNHGTEPARSTKSDHRMQKKSENVVHAEDGIRLRKLKNSGRLRNSPTHSQILCLFCRGAPRTPPMSAGRPHPHSSDKCGTRRRARQDSGRPARYLSCRRDIQSCRSGDSSPLRNADKSFWVCWASQAYRLSLSSNVNQAIFAPGLGAASWPSK